MEYILENAYLKVTVTTWGAQLKSVVRKCDQTEHMWQADKSLWGWHAPILFPHTGKVTDGIIEVDHKQYPSAQHGYARNMEFQFVEQTENSLILELPSSEETRKHFPYDCSLICTYTLDADSVCHTLTVQNLDEKKMPFGIGFHPAFRIPFDDQHRAEDYCFRFSETESPLCVSCLPLGLVHGTCYRLGNNINTIPVTEHLFDNDSYCMVNLKSRTLSICEKDSPRAVEVEIGDFPYCLIWSKPGMPRFLCIEPWESLPSFEGSSSNWEEKPAAAILDPGEAWSTTMRVTFKR